MAESELLQGTLEPTNEPMPLPKSPGSNCANLTTASTARLPLGHADQPVRAARQLPSSNSHVIPALLRRFHEATAQKRRTWWCGAAVHRCVNFCTSRYGGGEHSCDGAGARSLAGNTQPMLSHINVGTGVDCTIRDWRKPSPKWWVTKVGWFLMPETGWYAAQTAGCDAPASAWLYHEISLEAGLASTYQWFLENKTAFGGNDVFTSGRLCHGSGSTPLVSLDFIVENSRGEFLLAKEPTARRRVTGLCREGA